MIVSFLIANISLIYLPSFISLAFSLYLLLPIYSVANIDNYSWGTRGIKAVNTLTTSSQSSQTISLLNKLTGRHKKILIYSLWFGINLIVINSPSILSVIPFVMLLFLGSSYGFAFIYYFQHK